MKKTEAKKLLFYQLKPFFIDKGFKPVVTKFSGFIKPLETGFDWVYLNIDDYNPCQNIYYSVMKRIDSIDELWQQVDALYFNTQRLNLEYAYTLKFSYETINQLNTARYLPDVREEPDVQVCTDLILEFMSNKALPLLERFNDIREIDKEINGDNFWEDDWRKPYIFGGFPFKRLIIAYLCGNPHFERLYNYHNGLYDYSNKEYPVQIIDGKNAIEYLKEILDGSNKWNTA